jgi:hypothetical protein
MQVFKSKHCSLIFTINHDKKGFVLQNLSLLFVKKILLFLSYFTTIRFYKLIFDYMLLFFIGLKY